MDAAILVLAGLAPAELTDVSIAVEHARAGHRRVDRCSVGAAANHAQVSCVRLMGRAGVSLAQTNELQLIGARGRAGLSRV